MFAPLPGSGADIHEEKPVVYIAMSLMYPGVVFSSIREFGEHYETVLPSGEKQLNGLPDFNHFVLLLPPADAQERQVKGDKCTRITWGTVIRAPQARTFVTNVKNVPNACPRRICIPFHTDRECNAQTSP